MQHLPDPHAYLYLLIKVLKLVSYVLRRRRKAEEMMYLDHINLLSTQTLFFLVQHPVIVYRIEVLSRWFLEK